MTLTLPAPTKNVFLPPRLVRSGRRRASDAPLDVGGLVAWFAADRIGGYADGALVSSWPDFSGNGYHASATGSARPTFRSAGAQNAPALAFNGSSTHMQTPSFAAPLAIPFTEIIVAQITAQTVILGGLSSSDRYELQYTVAQAVFMYAGAVAGLKATASDWNIYRLRWNGAASYAWVNGLQSKALNPSTAGSGLKGLTIGDYYGLNLPFQGEIAEIIVYNRQLTDGEGHYLDRYLAQKYGVAVV